jgi:hypothetical protein
MLQLLHIALSRSYQALKQASCFFSDIGKSQKEADVMTFRLHVVIGILLLCFAGLMMGCSDDGTVVEPVVPTDEAPPAAVSGLQVTLYSNGDVALSWDASTQPNLRGYNVYRHIVSGNAIGALNRSPLANNRYIDTSAMRGYRYEYMVTAVSVKGLESAFATISVLTERDNTRDTGLVRD